jgi:hypothetical protein
MQSLVVCDFINTHSSLLASPSIYTQAAVVKGAMVLLSNDGFLAKLPELFALTREKGSVFISAKRRECTKL